MTGCCGNTSILVKTSAFLTLLAFVLLLLGYATPLWNRSGGVTTGLWESCSGNTCLSTVGSDLGAQAWFLAVQVIVTLALVIGFAALVITFVLMFDMNCGRNKALRIAGIVHEYMTAVFLLIGVVVYWIKGFVFFATNFTLDFSWGITVAALVIYAIAGTLLSVDIDRIDKEDEKDVETPKVESVPKTETSKPI